MFVGIHLVRAYPQLRSDAFNPRGVWRRTTLDSFLTTNPSWEAVGAGKAQSNLVWMWRPSSLFEHLALQDCGFLIRQKLWMLTATE